MPRASPTWRCRSSTRRAWTPELARPFTAEEKLACIRRELAYRRRVYPRRVERNQMSRELASQQLRLMEAIEADYVEAERKERLI